MLLDKEQVLGVLRAHQVELHRCGVKHAALFGSVARGEVNAASDIDILIELEPDAYRTVFGYAAAKRAVADLFSGQVDVVGRQRLKEGVKESAETDMIYAF